MLMVLYLFIWIFFFWIGDEIFSDTYKYKLVDNVIYEVYGKVKNNQNKAKLNLDVDE